MKIKPPVCKNCNLVTKKYKPKKSKNIHPDWITKADWFKCKACGAVQMRIDARELIPNA